MNRWNPFYHWSLKRKSMVIMLCFILLPTLIVSLLIYHQSNQLFKQQVIDRTQQNLNNMESSLVSIMEDVEDISGYIIFSNEFRDFMTLPMDDQNYYEDIHRLQDHIKGFFTFHLNNKNYFDSASIQGVNGTDLHVGERLNSDETQWDQLAIEREGRIFWSEPYEVSRTGWGYDGQQVISLVRVINDIYEIKKPNGLVRIRLDSRELMKSVTNGYADESNETFLLKDNGVVMFHQDQSKVGKPYPNEKLVEVVDQQEAVVTFQHNGEDHYAVIRNVNDQHIGMSLVSLVREDYILGEFAGIRYTMVIVISIVMLLTIVAFVGFVWTIVKPIIELTEQTKRFEYGNFNAKVKVRTNDEIGKLGTHFNAAVSHIQRLIETKYKLELQNKESELKALQSQINPHFLYNTLDMIRWTARIENAPDTGKSIEDLSRLFRISLSEGRVWITLKDEFAYVQSYLELQKRRLAGQLHYFIAVEAGIEQALVMKIIVQPLAENSIQHGFKRTHPNKRMYIKAYRTKQGIAIDVIDNGKGMNVNEIKYFLFHSQKERDGGGYALRNIHNRIVHAFGKKYGLELIHQEVGTCIRIHLPFIEKDYELQRILEGKDVNDD
ncbi:cache domain-containing sensor histidine kinase [Halalkalibacter hemicellulosilyticus]|uniref:Two-component sensor histidine kinase n=1 Tax=Halalkalibacter hemicellulosilyticusJCM 9152 TaxID=1236971 RepID=W4QMN7_9BACI|nr:sensor histidine kinase [Halalkalibacter hemicellulosilyticus]GAE32604.1 two-component sensor histidine kinase [Halalkalibacter hemicellulosilyticusJCM 9152]